MLVAKTFSLMRASLVGDVVNPTTTSGALSVTMLVGLAAIRWPYARSQRYEYRKSEQHLIKP